MHDRRASFLIAGLLCLFFIPLAWSGTSTLRSYAATAEATRAPIEAGTPLPPPPPPTSGGTCGSSLDADVDAARENAAFRYRSKPEVAGADGIAVFKLADPKSAVTLPLQASGVDDITLSPDGRWLLSVENSQTGALCNFGKTLLWDLHAPAKPIATYESLLPVTRANGSLGTAVWSSSILYALVKTQENQFALVNPNAPEAPKPLNVTGVQLDALWASNGKTLIVLTPDHVIGYDPQSQTAKWNLAFDTEDGNVISSPDGRYVLTNSQTTAGVELWLHDLTGDKSTRLATTANPTSGVSWKPDFSAIAVLNQGVSVYRLASPDKPVVFKYTGTEDFSDPYLAVWSTTGDKLLVVSDPSVILAWTVNATDATLDATLPLDLPDGSRDTLAPTSLTAQPFMWLPGDKSVLAVGTKGIFTWDLANGNKATFTDVGAPKAEDGVSRTLTIVPLADGKQAVIFALPDNPHPVQLLDLSAPGKTTPYLDVAALPAPAQ